MLAFVALAAALTRDEPSQGAPPAPRPAPEPPPLVAAILDRHLAHIRAVVDHVNAGGTIDDEIRRRGDEVNARIRRELVEPHGEAGRAAAEDAQRRLLRMAEALADHFEVFEVDVSDAA